jgi:hypothetical protein
MAKGAAFLARAEEIERASVPGAGRKLIPKLASHA